jgi:hypothetical protein
MGTGEFILSGMNLSGILSRKWLRNRENDRACGLRGDSAIPNSKNDEV